MVAAKIVIRGENILVDWGKVELDLFHQITRVIDLELESPNEKHDVYFSQGDFKFVKDWLLTEPWLFGRRVSEQLIDIKLNGYKLTLKQNDE